MNPAPNSQSVLAGVALVILGLLGGAMVFHVVPATNSTLLATIVGALAGALTVGGAGKLADKLTNNTGPVASSQADAPPANGPATP